MPVAIADSSALVALLKPDDTSYQRAMQVAAELIRGDVDIVVPSEVLAETLNILGKKVSNAAARQAAHKILAAQFIVRSSTPELLLKAADSLQRHKNSTSFVDALVMAWADREQTKFIFGFDAVFVQSGYR